MATEPDPIDRSGAAPPIVGRERELAAIDAFLAEWHECPKVPTAVADLALDGTEGRLHEMTCLGTFVQKLMVVRGGEGLVVNLLAPPARTDDARRLLRDVVADMTWTA